MSENPDDKKNGKLIPFPGGKDIDPQEVGVSDFFATHVGTVPQSELIDPQSIDKDVRDRIDYVNNQELVIATRNGSPIAATLDLLLQEISEEVSHLKWERRQSAKKGKSTAQLTIARIATLKQLAETILRKKESGFSERLSTKDPRIQKMFSIWMEMFYTSMEKSGVGSEVIDIVFSQVRADMIEWESKMDSIND